MIHCSRSHGVFLGNEGIFFLPAKITYYLFHPRVTLSQCKISEESMHQNKTTKPTTFSRLLLSILVGWKSLWDFHLVGRIKAGNFLKTFAFKHMTDHPKSSSQFLEIKLILFLQKDTSPPRILLCGSLEMSLCLASSSIEQTRLSLI